PPLESAPLLVFDSTRSPQQARTLFLRKGKLCESKRCHTCLSLDAQSWLPCRAARPFALFTMSANASLASFPAVLFALLLLSIPLLALVLALRSARPKPSSASPHTAKESRSLAIISSVLGFASSWWFPWIAGFGTGMNMFTLVFTAATVVLFLAAVLARPRRWASSALINALGATLGTALMLYLIRASHGDPLDYLKEAYPTVLSSPAWLKAMGYMDRFGAAGMLLVSVLPIFLHPVVVFGLLSGMNDATILLIIMTGRTIKYLIMARVTLTAPHLLRYFGIKAALFEKASAAARKAA
ncbi:MAG: hypothetical protein SGPRY_011549, partial [Prymnesium sp.]